jgi:hypothetical protein
MNFSDLGKTTVAIDNTDHLPDIYQIIGEAARVTRIYILVVINFLGKSKQIRF